jgi:hypothetical protein
MALSRRLVDAGIARLDPHELDHLLTINRMYEQYGERATDMLSDGQHDFLWYVIRRIQGAPAKRLEWWPGKWVA